MNRDDATRRVLISLAVGPSKINLPYVADDGTRPIVVTTPNEYLSAVVERIEAAGGSANVILAEARRFKIFVIEGLPTSASDSEPATDEFNDDISMGMFDIKAGRSGTFRMRGGVASRPSVETFAYA